MTEKISIKKLLKEKEQIELKIDSIEDEISDLNYSLNSLQTDIDFVERAINEAKKDIEQYEYFMYFNPFESKLFSFEFGGETFITDSFFGEKLNSIINSEIKERQLEKKEPDFSEMNVKKTVEEISIYEKYLEYFFQKYGNEIEFFVHEKYAKGKSAEDTNQKSIKIMKNGEIIGFMVQKTI
jgi:chromosome segregation ATPase